VSEGETLCTRNRADVRKPDWYGPLWLLRLPFDMLGFTYVLGKLGIIEHGSDHPYDSMKFPIMFCANPELDRIAYTRKFVQFVKSQGEDRVMFDKEHGHFMVSNNAPCMARIIQFLAEH
jgi:hypothetical protein